MFDIPYPNTRYAEALDYAQQLDYEDELAECHSLEEQEERDFAQRCKQSKVPVSRLKKYETELRKIQNKASEEFSELKKQIWKTKSVKKAQELRAKLSDLHKRLEAEEKALREQYFKERKTRK